MSEKRRTWNGILVFQNRGPATRQEGAIGITFPKGVPEVLLRFYKTYYHHYSLQTLPVNEREKNFLKGKPMRDDQRKWLGKEQEQRGWRERIRKKRD